jgi:hypothetical protein
MKSEELAAAEEAEKLIDTLEPISPDTPVETLRRAYDQARRAVAQDFSSETVLNEVRKNVLLALNEVIGPLQARTLAQEKIYKTKKLLEAWIKLLQKQTRPACASATRMSPQSRCSPLDDFPPSVQLVIMSVQDFCHCCAELIQNCNGGVTPIWKTSADQLPGAPNDLLSAADVKAGSGNLSCVCQASIT